ncbi:MULTISPECIES: alanine--tRNA ligase [unclassified Polaromonas]|uniref:alanine--tRNA ligase n=1 Tax=unclassified Polaromonas TaxID=2638319 RepID=UPI000BC84A32|nr:MULTISPECIES: alanine--tRNA ligase [unclassified Polaromonas]OYY33683.1 MAG: alanine--tRNA ligase [Polaromonas sp. 35-63-35]OYZ18215.1 MAG: alanine--tRNA ligase [Polaromonas sp. 16-63-31]OYZ75877.1 MAG: alanine--tRNA ligase [Polaromonas sp. 24-63-21]OZA51746.1 MAG: alanine--tRNA ligase [Polaromonas sp. 17-63-33]OZA86526.1 MAG: alanine--tRNA ligase [Polaromonas sp. 39-63-25]
MSTPTFTVADIRKTFLDFFASKGHTVVASSSLVPGNDPTLMFTNSGMVQFKDVFLGTDKRSYVRAASVQACLRAGGKHNDLENVGYTARHHTFFEMLGNWSFGDYFKRESLKWAWELLTEVYKLPADKLWATVYIDDDEAYDIWTKEIGLPPERVVRIGDNKGAKYASDNFWMMADTGPCGPCSEIFFDHGPEIAGGPPGSPEQDGDRYIEIWNNVFMQFDMQPDGSVKPLPAPCVDTGMGLERLAAILQHVHSNYEIDIFDALIKAASRETGEKDLDNKSLRVIADHIRATAFLVSDGVNPSNEGRGYVQRRIIRRAIRHGYKLGKKTPFFHKLVADLVRLMGEAYPKLRSDEARITAVLKAEEERFFETLEIGMTILDTALAPSTGSGQAPKMLPGDVAFKLHDTYGFPLDLSADVCRERGVEVDEAGFTAAMDKQKNQARAAGKFKMDRALEYTGEGNVFTGYEALEASGKIVALYADGVPVAALKTGQQGVVVLDNTPFYAESGGQVGDQGELVSGSAHFAVGDTQKIKADVYGHHGSVAQGTLNVGDHVSARVNLAVRAATVRNHSATHLMHKALREVLGDHVQQKGSLVDAEKTRFDFAHNAPVTDEQIREIEARVNAEILANAATDASVMDMEAAQKTGAMMLFGEKYGDQVRVLSIGSSKELCGGTHVARTGDIGFFTITAEGGVASGVRRIEAVTGLAALNHVQTMEATLGGVAGTLKVTPHEVPARVSGLLEQIRDLEKEVTAIKGKLASAQGDELMSQAVDVKGLKVLAAKLEGADAKTLRETMDKLKDKLKTAVIVLAAVDGDKVQIAAGVTADSVGKVKAGELVNFVAQQVGGKGGGKADMAMAGGTDASKLPAALASVQGWVSERA